MSDFALILLNAVGPGQTASSLGPFSRSVLGSTKGAQGSAGQLASLSSAATPPSGTPSFAGMLTGALPSLLSAGPSACSPPRIVRSQPVPDLAATTPRDAALIALSLTQNPEVQDDAGIAATDPNALAIADLYPRLMDILKRLLAGGTTDLAAILAAAKPLTEGSASPVLAQQGGVDSDRVETLAGALGLLSPSAPGLPAVGATVSPPRLPVASHSAGLIGMLERLVSTLDRLADRSAAPDSPTLAFLRNLLQRVADLRSPGSVAVPDAQALASAQTVDPASVTTSLDPLTPRALAPADSRNSTPLPDLVYVALPASSDQSATTLQAIEIPSNTLPVASESLRVVASKLRELIDEIAQMDPNARGDAARLSPQVMAASQLPLFAPLETARPVTIVGDKSALTAEQLSPAFPQAQAAINDMLEKMRGGMTIDGDRLRAVIHLDPPSLGRLHVWLTVGEGDRVVAHINADRSGTHDFLQQHSDDLRQGLAQQGFAHDRITVRFQEDEAEESFARFVDARSRTA